MSGAQFEIGLTDKVTGVANGIVGAFDSILHAAVNAAGGPEKVMGAIDAVGKAGEVLGVVSKAFGPIGAAAGVAADAVISAVKAAGIAIAALAVTIAGVAIGLADVAIKAGQAKEKMIASFSAITGGQGKAVLDTVDKLGAALGLTREELTPYTTKLLAAGVSADKLEASLRAVASANAMIEGGAEKVTSLLAKLNEQGIKGSKIKFSPTMLVGTGISEAELMKALGMTPKMFELAKKQFKLTGAQIADAIVKTLGEKGAGPLANQANQITSIWAKFKESVTKLFDDVTQSSGYKEFIGALKKFFSFGTAASGQLKTTITSMFSAAFSWAAKTLPYIKLGLEKIVIAVLKAYIAVKLWYKEGGKKDILITMQGLAAAIKVIAPLLIGTAKAALGLLQIVARFQTIGSAITTGLANGITAGVGKVTGAIRGLGQAAIAALKGALSIASPSKEFAKLGAHTAAGFQQGIQAGTGGVKAASASMAAGALSGAAGAPKASGGKGGGVTVNVAAGAIQINGAQGGAQAMTELALSSLIERIAVTQGLGGATE